ncbi:MAG: hypothetical protein IK063_05915 [Clostridia bacterium]|nr:hypothetical protein [Clostridia bacterium]MBR6005743.1 hypothetical protein [Clostridia bacterium]
MSPIFQGLFGNISQRFKNMAYATVGLGIVAVAVGFIIMFVGLATMATEDNPFMAFIGFCIVGGGVIYAVYFSLFFYVIGEVLERLKSISETNKEIADNLRRHAECSSDNSAVSKTIPADIPEI